MYVYGGGRGFAGFGWVVFKMAQGFRILVVLVEWRWVGILGV